MTKNEIIKEIENLVKILNTEQETYIEQFNKKQEERKSTYRLDRNRYYPYIVGYVGQGLMYLLEQVKDGDMA